MWQNRCARPYWRRLFIVYNSSRHFQARAGIRGTGRGGKSTLRDVVRIACTGRGIGKLLALTVKDIDYDERCIWTSIEKRRNSGVRCSQTMLPYRSFMNTLPGTAYPISTRFPSLYASLPAPAYAHIRPCADRD